MSRGRFLLLLIGFLGVALVYAWFATPRQGRLAPPDQPHRSLPQRPAELADQQVAEVADLDLSGAAEATYAQPHNNLFGPVFPPPAPAPAPSKAQPKPVKRPPPPPVKAPPQAQARPEPLPPLQVLGYLDKAGQKTLFLSSQGQVYLLEKGERFADNLQVLQLNDQAATITRLSDGRQVRLQLNKAKSQRLPSSRFQSGRPSFVAPQNFDPKPSQPGNPSKKAEQ